MNKWFIKNITGIILKNKIKFFPTKNIFPLILLPWSHFGRRQWRFLDFEGQSMATSGLFPNDLVEWQRTSVLVLLLLTKLVGRFDETLSFIVKLLFPYEVTFKFSPYDFPFWSFSLISEFSLPSFLMEDTSIYRWR